MEREELTCTAIEITFNASPIKEMSSILLLKRLIDEEHLNRMSCIDMRRLHVISARELRRLSVSGKFKAESNSFSIYTTPVIARQSAGRIILSAPREPFHA